MTDAVLPLTGELTLAHAAAQLAAGQRFLAAAGAGGAVTFDLGQIDRADTCALALACQWSRQAAARGLTLRWANVPPSILALARAHAAEDIFVAAPPAAEPPQGGRAPLGGAESDSPERAGANVGGTFSV